MKDKIERLLKDAKIKYEFIPLPENLPLDVESHMKFHKRDMRYAMPNMVFKTEKGLIAAQRRADTQIDNQKLKDLLRVKRLSLAGVDDLKSFGLEPGVVPPLGYNLPFYMDKKVLENDEIYSGGGNKLFALKINPRDLIKINKATLGDFTIASNQLGKKRILTGDTPTGKLHIGHYVGTLENRVKLQSVYDTYILLADVHSYANGYKDPDKINDSVYNVFLDNLAVGVDPKKATIFLESGVPEIYELYSFFLTMVNHGRVIRNPSVKEEIVYKKLDPSVAFIVYPILQTADILAFNADLVPVGEDQLPVIEQAREIARDFNKVFGETFVVPRLSG